MVDEIGINEVRTGSGSDRVSPRSGRQHKALGRKPQDQITNNNRAREAGDSGTEPRAVARGCGSEGMLPFYLTSKRFRLSSHVHFASGRYRSGFCNSVAPSAGLVSFPRVLKPICLRGRVGCSFSFFSSSKTTVKYLSCVASFRITASNFRLSSSFDSNRGPSAGSPRGVLASVAALRRRA